MLSTLLQDILTTYVAFPFNDTSAFVDHFVWSPREREKRDRRDSRRDEREEQGGNRNRNEIEETEEIKTFPLYPYLLQGQQALPNCKPVSAGRPGDVKYTTHSHYPTIPKISLGKKKRDNMMYLDRDLLMEPQRQKTYLRTCAPSED